MATLPKPGPVQPERLERPVEDPVLGQDGPPRVDLHQVATTTAASAPRRPAAPRARAARDLGHVERDRERQQRVGDRHRGGDQHRAAGRSCGRRRSRSASRSSARPYSWTTWPENVSSCQNAATNSTASEPEVGDHQPADRPRQQQRELQAGPRRAAASWCALALDFRPRLDPLGVVLADRSAVVTAVLASASSSTRPSTKYVLVVGVEDLAVVLDRRSRRTTSRSPAPRRTTPPPAALAFGRDDVVHPHVHAVRVLGLRRDHPRVRPARSRPPSGSVVLTGTLSASSRFAITCHVVPTHGVAAA